MLRKRRYPQIEMRPARPAPGFEHIAGESIAVLDMASGQPGRVRARRTGGGGRSRRCRRRWAGRDRPRAYRRNYERLSRALDAANARPRQHGGAEAARAKAAPDGAPGGQRWEFRTGIHFLDVEGRSSETPGYQELLYEAGRFELAAGLSVDVASPEDIEHYAHVRRHRGLAGAADHAKRAARARAPELTEPLSSRPAGLARLGPW